MANVTVLTYGPGGYDTSKPNNNVVDSAIVTLDPAGITLDSLQNKAQAALTNNIAALALPTPSFPLSNAAQQALVNQVTALTRQMDAIIRLLLNVLDSTDGT